MTIEGFTDNWGELSIFYPEDITLSVHYNFLKYAKAIIIEKGYNIKYIFNRLEEPEFKDIYYIICSKDIRNERGDCN